MSPVITAEQRLFLLYVNALQKQYPVPAFHLAKQQLAIFEQQQKGDTTK